MRFSAYPIKNLRRRPGRTVFAATGIALAVAAYVSMTLLFGGITDGWKNSLDASGVHAIAIQDSQIDWLTSSIPEKAAKELQSHPDVSFADGELISFLTTEEGVSVLAVGWGPDAKGWDSLEYISGNRPKPGNEAEAVIGEGISSALDLSVGDVFSLDNYKLRVSGIIRSTDAFSGGRVLVSLSGLQEEMFRQNTVTVIRIGLKNPEDPAVLSNLAPILSQNYQGVALRPTAQLSQDNRIIELLEALRRAVVYIISLVAVVGMANIMLMAVNERRSEIGLLNAIGWSRSRILAVFVAEGLALAAIAGLFGLAAGYGILQIIKQSATLAAFISSEFDGLVFLQGYLWAILIGAVSAVLPALRALSVAPDTAMRAV